MIKMEKGGEPGMGASLFPGGGGDPAGEADSRFRAGGDRVLAPGGVWAGGFLVRLNRGLRPVWPIKGGEKKGENGHPNRVGSTGGGGGGTRDLWHGRGLHDPGGRGRGGGCLRERRSGAVSS